MTEVEIISHSRCATNNHCEKCNYATCKKSSWSKHITSKKHLEKEDLVPQHMCDVCDKTYKGKSGLWKHNKVCAIASAKPTETEIAQLTLVIMDRNKEIDMMNKEIRTMNEKMDTISVQNKELTEVVKQCMTKVGNTTTNSHNTNSHNSHNSHFNLQFFLNETCKDALNMTDFISSIVIKLTDLQKVQKDGYVDGMTAIISNALDSLDTNKRPIHCSDLKRETMYIKEGDVWEKDNDEKKNMKDMIRFVEHKSIKTIPAWEKNNPECIKGDHKDNVTYLKMVHQVTGGNLQKEDENIDKIIHNVAKTITIEKR